VRPIRNKNLNRKQLAVSFDGMSHETAFAKLSACLNRALEASTLEDSRQAIAEAIQRAERLMKAVSTAAIRRGRKGGSKTAERGPEYFRKIAAMRKTRAGGRPKKTLSD
jgi:hypothetical protein